MSNPLSDLSLAQQNSRSCASPLKEASLHIITTTHDIQKTTIIDSNQMSTSNKMDNTIAYSSTPEPENHTQSTSQLTSGHSSHQSPRKAFSPVKYRLQDDAQATSSPPGSPAESTMRFNEGLTRAIGNMQDNYKDEPQHFDNIDETDLTLSFDDKTVNDETIGDLSTISAIPADMTRFANLRNSPTKSLRSEPRSPSKQLRNSVIYGTPGTTQRPLHLLSASRNSNSSNEDEEATPRRQRNSGDSATDLLNFTGQTNIIIPPPGSAPRTARRSPSGRGGFPIRVNPSPSHQSQASVDRERAGGRSPNKQHTSSFSVSEKTIPATPAGQRHSMYAGFSGLPSDLLDLDLEPMATPRSIPTITPRELETLRSELQSRISGLEATLSGKEAEVNALKRSITDAEVRAGKTSEELRTERLAKEEIEHQKDELERRSREMEDVLREIKQNAFVEEREREKLRRQAEEAEKRTEELEVKILELNASLDTLRSERIKSSPSPNKHMDPATPGGSINVDWAVKDATEKVARELHTLYRSKHERKVADLKVSYEKRWIKQVEQLRAELKASQDEVLKFQTEREATMSGVIPGQTEAVSRMEGQIEELRRWNDTVTAEKKVLEAQVVGLKGQIETVTIDSESLRKELEQERVEKGELVAQVDVFLALNEQQEQQQQTQPVSPPRSEDGRPSSAAAASPNKFRTSLGGASGVPAPGRPRPVSMLQKPTKFSGIPGPGSGLKAPSSSVARGGYGARGGGLMEGITRMGAAGR